MADAVRPSIYPLRHCQQADFAATIPRGGVDLPVLFATKYSRN